MSSIIEAIKTEWEWVFAFISATAAGVGGWWNKKRKGKFDELERMQNRLNVLNETLDSLFSGQIEDRKTVQVLRLQVVQLESILEEIETRCTDKCAADIIKKHRHGKH